MTDHVEDHVEDPEIPEVIPEDIPEEPEDQTPPEPKDPAETFTADGAAKDRQGLIDDLSLKAEIYFGEIPFQMRHIAAHSVGGEYAGHAVFERGLG